MGRAKRRSKRLVDIENQFRKIQAEGQGVWKFSIISWRYLPDLALAAKTNDEAYKLLLAVADTLKGLERAWSDGDRFLWRRSKKVNAFVKKAYKRTGGPTAELERVYRTFADNERRRNAKQSSR